MKETSHRADILTEEHTYGRHAHKGAWTCRSMRTEGTYTLHTEGHTGHEFHKLLTIHINYQQRGNLFGK